jgi:DNA polymerase I
VQRLERFREVWLCDFEFISRPGERPIPVCIVAYEAHTNRRTRLWRDQLGRHPPFGTGRDTLFVAYFASAEIGCFLALDWPVPAAILDLYTEFRVATNGAGVVPNNKLLTALTHYGLDSIGVEEKQDMIDLILSGGPWSRDEVCAILNYCQSDVDALRRLLPAMLPRIDLPRALYRGRYMAAVAAMEWNGVPINRDWLHALRENWEPIQDRLILRIDPDYGVYEGRTFKTNLFERYLVRNNIPWPRLPSGRLNLEDDTFREMARVFQVLNPLRELRHALSEMRLNDLAVGSDGRNRCLLSPFGAKSGRNTPSNTRFIFGPAVWLRHLITPPPGHGLAYIDWSQQEIGIAAALSGDRALLSAYESGDCYLAFAKQDNAVPPDATEETHPVERDLYKNCHLGIGYGMEAESLALRINRPVIVARHLLQRHKEIYRTSWRWGDNAVNHADIHGKQWTVFGWTRWVSARDYNPRSLRNFHAQAHGAEMLRLACCLGIENGIEICAPVHDALLICAPVEGLAHDTEQMRAFMAEASRIVLGGFVLRTGNPKPIYHPDHLGHRRADTSFHIRSWPSRYV